MKNRIGFSRRAGLHKGSRPAALISVALALVLTAMFVAGYAVAGENPMPAKGVVPSVNAHEVEEGNVLPLQGGKETPSERPNHPPPDQIPPMPMHDDSREGEAPLQSSDPGQPIIHNSATGETKVIQLNPKGTSKSPARGGGYSGPDAAGIEELPASFSGDMSKITNTGGFPWRMNVKLYMRYGTNWASCSGTMRDAETILTAGHCVYDRDTASWADEIWVYPGYNGSGWDPWGWGHSTWMASWTGWTDSGDWNYDAGLVQIDRAVGMLTGWYAWAVGGDCAWHTAATYNNGSYPAEDCGSTGLHNGNEMYYWTGHFDSCSSWNRLQVNTSGGCFNAVWGGMSGGGAYYIDGDTRYVHAMCSTSDRATFGRYTRQWQDWVDYTNNTFIPETRGSAFDLQALDMNAAPATIMQGGSTTLLNHFATNPTNGTANKSWIFRVYLSGDDTISSADTLLSTQGYDLQFNGMSSARVNMSAVAIPYNTPPGDYCIGVVYDAATDGRSSNNATNTWDVARIHVDPETTPPTPNPMGWLTEPREGGTASILMTASTASDPTPPVQYFFDYYSSPTGGTGGNDSLWQTSASYADVGLSTNHQYGYRVKARDGNGNETGYSSVSYDYTQIETPTGITFGGISSTHIQAASANTPSGLSLGNSGLWIENVTNGANSGWKQNNGFWSSGSLTPNTRYGFRAMARNGDAATTPYGPTANKYTLANPPGVNSFANRTATSVKARWTAAGNPAGTVYFCENTTLGTNSGWITATSWNNRGLTPGTSYTYRVKAKNGDGVQTAWTGLGSVSTKNRRITVTSPDGGEIWHVGDSATITWTSIQAGATVKIAISRDGGSTWKIITSSASNTGTHTWTVAKPVSSKCRIKVISNDFPTAKDISNANFSIKY